MKWEPFKPAHKPPPGINYLKKHFGMKKREALAYREYCQQAKVYLNNRYEVEVRDHRLTEKFPAMVWLSIKRLDKEPIHDWRDLQRIKNELVGPEHEAVELYPAESRLVDACNQFHLWVLKEKGLKFPFGMFDGRAVNYDPESARELGGKQRSMD